MKQNYDAEIAALKVEVENLKRVVSIIEQLAINVEKIAIETKYMREGFNDLAVRVKELESKPVKKYENIITKIIDTVIVLLLGAIAAMIGLKK